MTSKIATAVFVLASACAPAFAATSEAPLAADTRSKLMSSLDAMGYETRDLARNETTYRARIVDRGTGGIVQAVFDANTGELLEARLEE